MKLHPRVVAYHAFSVGQALCITIVSVFSSNVSQHNWDVFAQSYYKKNGIIAVLNGLNFNSVKHRALIDLIKLLKDTKKCPYLLAQGTADRINKGIIANGKRGPTQSTMLEDDKLLVDIWELPKPTLAFSIESLCMIFGELDSQTYQSPLSMDKQFKTECSYLRTQLGVLVNARNLVLSMLDSKRQDLVKILITTWNSLRKRFTMHELASFLGLAPSIALTKNGSNALESHFCAPHVSH